MIMDLFYLLVIPGFLYTALIGMFACWIDRKVTARLQWRQGPPFFQPLADILKLMGKETFVPQGASLPAFMSAPLAGISAVILVSTMLWLLNIYIYSGFVGDLIVLVYLLLVPSLSMIIGASASRNPFSALGASREMKLILAYELPFLIALLTVIFKTGTLLFGGIIIYQQGHGMLISSLSGFIAFSVSLLVAQAKLGFVPFDIAEAEQEIMGGTLLEYSGPLLAVWKLMKMMMLFALPMLLITLFMGGLNPYSFGGVMIFVLKYAAILFLMILIKNTNPRLRIDQAIRFFWGPVTALAVAGLLFALAGL